MIYPFAIPDHVHEALVDHPRRARWCVRSDGRHELRLMGDGKAYDFQARAWVTMPPFAVVCPDAWRLIGPEVVQA